MTWDFTPELEESILTRIEDGESIRQICRDETMPSRRTVLRWMRSNPDFAAKCACAREEQAEVYFDKQDGAVDGMLRGEITSDVARVAISAYQWRASKLAPKKYGDKVQQELSGPNGGPIVTSNTTLLTADLEKKSLDELTRLFTEKTKV